MTEKGIVFFPDPDLVGTPKDVRLDYDDVWFTTADGVRLHGWWLPQPGCPTILWFHGNGGNISHRLENIALLRHQVRVQIFIFDYREYGLSGGDITRAGTFLDADAAYNCLTTDLGVPAADLILFGRSLGSALALDQAVKNPARALILESAFTSSLEMMRLYAPFLGHRQPQGPIYDNLGLIPRLTIPVLIIHGELDEVIPVAMGRTLYTAAPEPKELYIIPGAHHNDTYNLGGDAYFGRWRGFIQPPSYEPGTDGSE
jgi:fermentation-respiration switch protein FrsA (DUF1100 family)